MRPFRIAQSPEVSRNLSVPKAMGYETQDYGSLTRA